VFLGGDDGDDDEKGISRVGICVGIYGAGRFGHVRCMRSFVVPISRGGFRLDPQYFFLPTPLIGEDERDTYTLLGAWADGPT
jgi:hypothetical protein